MFKSYFRALLRADFNVTPEGLATNSHLQSWLTLNKMSSTQQTSCFVLIERPQAAELHMLRCKDLNHILDPKFCKPQRLLKKTLAYFFLIASDSLTKVRLLLNNIT